MESERKQMKIIRENNGIAVIEDDGDFYVVGLSRPNLQLMSIGRDNPACGGRWVANFCRCGLNYVSHPRSRNSAISAFRRFCKA